jgi:sphingolipid 8-(E)-desaturase
MRAFRIGRVEGRWTNFVPPIQGGIFRKQLGDNVIEKEAPAIPESESSLSCSEEPSPVFEPADSQGLQSRKSRNHVSSSCVSPASSVSSVDLEDDLVHSNLSHLEAYTKKEIDSDLLKYPSLESNTQDEIVRKYRALNDRIREEGLYRCPYSAYLIEICRYVLLASMSLAFLKMKWYCASGIALGLFWHQLVFTAHDAGHMGITHSFTIDTVIGIIIADFLGGLSLGWWKRNHNVHHIVTNSPEHDPDIEHMPLFAVSHRFLQSLRSTYYDHIMHYDAFAKFFVRNQQYLYYPVLLFGRFNLYRLSWQFLLLGQGPRKGPAWWHRWFEIAGQVFFWYLFGYCVVYKSIPTAWDRFCFVMLSHMITMPLHVQITLSHFAMSTADLGANESFPQKMLRTTMDVDCPEWLDFLHGGLQFQAIHHLYPRIPRHNLRKTQKLVRQFCDEVGIPYAIYGFADGNKEVIGRLGEVGRQAAILAECQRVMAQKGELGH